MCKPGRRAVVQPGNAQTQLDQVDLDFLVAIELRSFKAEAEVGNGVAFTAFDVTDALRVKLGRDVFVGHYEVVYSDGARINDGVRLTTHRLADELLGASYAKQDRQYNDEHAFVYAPTTNKVAIDTGKMPVLPATLPLAQPAQQSRTLVFLPIK